MEGERNSFEQQLKQEKQEHKSDVDRLEGERNSFEQQLKQEKQEHKSDVDRLEGERNSFEQQLEQEKQAHQSEVKRLEEEINSLKADISQRFPDGWHLYQKFLALPSEDRERVASYLYSSDFTAFITSGSQLGSLESIWTKTLEAKRNGSGAAETMWDVFRYCVRLVNAARGKELIRVLEPNIGDKYDSNKHSTSGTDSAAQGTVKEVILPGFQNLVKKQIVQKSNVRVG